MSDLMAHGTKAALGSPWERPLEGRLEQIAIDSEVLAGNLLGDPARRPIYPPVAGGTSSLLCAEDHPQTQPLGRVVRTGRERMWVGRAD